jgi:membrane-bound ClpP family serine protease
MEYKGDLIADLPIDQKNNQNNSVLSHVLGSNDMINDSTREAITKYIKDPLLVSILTGIVMLPWIDELIEKFFSSARDSVYSKIAIKMVIAGLSFYLISNWGLARFKQ